MKLEFKRITAEDAYILPEFFAKRSTLTCDSVFLDTFLWKDYYTDEYAIIDGRAVFWKMDFEGETYAGLPMCTAEELPHYFKELRKYFNEELGKKLLIYLADERALEILQLDPEKFEVTEDVDSADYIYDAELLKNLPGKKYHKKKNHINAFLKEYEGRFEYRTLTPADKDDIWRFLSIWRDKKGEDAEETLDPEIHGIHSLLSYTDVLDVRMGGVYVDGKMEAFSIGTYNPAEKMAIISIEKANPDIRGMYPFINQQMLIHEYPDAVLVNREDDVGIPGLRKAKQSYYPIMFARKYQIREK